MSADVGVDRINDVRLDTMSAEVVASTPPAVVSSSWDVNTRRFHVRFNTNVLNAIGPATLRIRNRDTGQWIDMTGTTMRSNFATNTATFELVGYPQGLPDGRFQAVIRAQDVVDQNGQQLASDLNHDFTMLRGDANQDSKVDFADLVILARNFGRTQRAFTDGNFNYDANGNADFADLVMLARNFNKSMSAPAPASLFGSEPIGKNNGIERKLS
jgi:hypothetical protein